MSNETSHNESFKSRKRQLTVRVHDRDHALVERLVASSGMSEAALVRLAIQNGLPAVEKSLMGLTGQAEVAS